MSTLETHESPEDSPKRMSEEEYFKFYDEVKKSVNVLGRIIKYSENIVDWALEISAINTSKISKTYHILMLK